VVEKVLLVSDFQTIKLIRIFKTSLQVDFLTTILHLSEQRWQLIAPFIIFINKNNRFLGGNSPETTFASKGDSRLSANA